MSNAVTPFIRGQVSKVFGTPEQEDTLSAGIAASYAVMGYRGKVWSVKHRGDEVQLMREDNDGPRNSIEVVILAASRNISKIFYAVGYTEGSNAPPDCFSNNGVVPEPTSPHLQAPTCASCPRNVWGSKISVVSGKPGKECQDSKRLAIVPLQDIPNQLYGGPMLLRVPAASLQELAQFGSKMHQMGYPHYTYGTRISFDTAEAYPKFVFQAIRPLTDDEAVEVLALKDAPAVTRILAESSDFTPAMPPQQEAVNQAFEQPPTQTQAAATPSPAQRATTWGSTSQPSPSTGPESTTPAQPAAQPPPTQEQVAPATASPQPTPAPVSPKASTPSPAGSAGTANTARTQGFGSTSPLQPSKPGNGSAQPGNGNGADASPPPRTSTASEQVVQGGGAPKEVVEHVQQAQHVKQEAQQGEALSEFEAGLDAMMAKLLPR